MSGVDDPEGTGLEGMAMISSSELGGRGESRLRRFCPTRSEVLLLELCCAREGGGAIGCAFRRSSSRAYRRMSSLEKVWLG